MLITTYIGIKYKITTMGLHLLVTPKLTYLTPREFLGN